MTEIPTTFPETHNKDYEVQAPRQVGERVLAGLAATSPRVRMWTFDAERDKWTHVAGNYTEKIEYDANDKVVSYSTNMPVPGKMLVPPSANASFYNTRSLLGRVRVDSDFETGGRTPLMAQIPSSAEIEAGVRLGLLGYQDCRIVTSLGVTVLQNGNIDPNENIFLPGITIEESAVDDLMRQGGLVQATHDTFTMLNEHYDGAINLSFYEHEAFANQ